MQERRGRRSMSTRHGTIERKQTAPTQSHPALTSGQPTALHVLSPTLFHTAAPVVLAAICYQQLLPVCIDTVRRCC